MIIELRPIDSVQPYPGIPGHTHLKAAQKLLRFFGDEDGLATRRGIMRKLRLEVRDVRWWNVVN